MLTYASSSGPAPPVEPTHPSRICAKASLALLPVSIQAIVRDLASPTFLGAVVDFDLHYMPSGVSYPDTFAHCNGDELRPYLKRKAKKI